MGTAHFVSDIVDPTLLKRTGLLTESTTLEGDSGVGLLEQMLQRLGTPPADTLNDESLVGFFQSFRGDKFAALHGLYDGLTQSESLAARLDELFQAAGDDRRPSGGRDAYFVVRHPNPMTPQDAEQMSHAWIGKLAELSGLLGQHDVAQTLGRIQNVRVLEGIPPKHPKAEVEKCDVLLALQKVLPDRIRSGFASSPAFEIIYPAYYFTCCDSFVAAHLMWPLHPACANIEEPFEEYFRMWKHGIKYRVFADEQLDVYLPRI